ncbi:MAG: hypothetical protein Q9212_001115 [Teloschistes hypoglaucus]
MPLQGLDPREADEKDATADGLVTNPFRLLSLSIRIQQRSTMTLEAKTQDTKGKEPSKRKGYIHAHPYQLPGPSIPLFATGPYRFVPGVSDKQWSDGSHVDLVAIS